MSGVHSLQPHESRPSTEQITTILESITDGFMHLDTAWRLTYVNRRMETFVGRKREELLERSLWDIFPEYRGSYLESRLQEAMVTQQTVHLEGLRPWWGRWFEFHLYPTPDGLSVYFRDITERKLAEEALRHSRDAFRLLTEAMPQLVWITDATGVWEYANQQWYAFTGGETQETLGEGWISCYHPDDQPKMVTIWQTSLLTSSPFEVEARLREGKTGVYRWFLVRGVPLRKTYDRVWKWVGTCTDIHEKKRIEEALQESEVRFRHLVQSNIIGITVIDLEGPILEANDAFLSMLGYTRQDLEAGRLNWRALTPPKYQDPSTQAVKEVRTTGAAHLYEKEYVAKNGKRVPALVGSVVFRKIGSRQLAISFVVDLTARKAAEEALRESEARFHSLVESNLIGITVSDLAGAISEANDAFLQLVGYSREDLAAGRLYYTALTPPDYQEQHWQIRKELLTTGKVQLFEKEYLTKEGKRVPVLVGRTLFRREGTAPQAITFVVDQTARKEIERQKDLFLGMTSHELKTPLAALRGILQLIQRRMKRVTSTADSLSPELRAFFEGLSKSVADSVRQVDVQTRLINDLLDVSRMTANTLKLDCGRCDLSSIVRQTVEDLRVTVPDRTLLLDVPEQTPVYVWADGDRISQVITNYVTNALRYSPVDQPVQIGLTLLENRARVWVRDQGPGLSEEAQKELWQRFRQIKNVPMLSGSGKGLGLGLYICETLITQHQGEVGVESAPGEGSTFWFTLPLIT